IAGRAQMDGYFFEGRAGEAVTMAAMNTSGSLSARLDLYDPSGTQVPAGNNGFGNTGSGSVVLPFTGTYTIIVRDYSLAQIGGHNIHSRFTTPGRCGNAIACGQTLRGSITGRAQTEGYFFSGNAGEAVMLVAMSTSGTLSARLDVYDPSGTLVPRGNNGF